MNKIYKLDDLSNMGKDAHIKLTDGREFDCKPDCIVCDDDTYEDLILVWSKPDGIGYELRESEISEVIEI